MGELPSFELKPIVKAKRGDLRDMVLPGGGDIRTRIWASIGVKVNSLAKWQNTGAFKAAAGKDDIGRLEQFIREENAFGKILWGGPSRKKRCKSKSKSVASLNPLKTGKLMMPLNCRSC